MSNRPFKVRPAPAKTKDGPFQAILSEQHLKDFGGHNQAGAWVLGKKPVPVLLWREAPQKGQAQTSVGRVVLLSDTVRQLAGLALGDDVSLVPDDDTPEIARNVTLTEGAAESDGSEIMERTDLQAEAEEAILQSSFIACGQQVPLKSRAGRHLVVQEINNSLEGRLYQISEKTEMQYKPSAPALEMKVPRGGIFGADRVLDHLDEILKFFDQERIRKWDHHGPNSRSILLTGPAKCGKTSIIRSVSRLNWPKVIKVKLERKKIANLNNAFKQGQQLGRALIVLDEIDKANLEKHEHQEYAKILLDWHEELDQDQNCRILLLAGTRDVDDIDEKLLDPDGFSRVFRIRLPSTENREAILRSLFREIIDDEGFIKELARRTPAFSGGELRQLRREIGDSWNRDPHSTGAEGMDKWLSYMTASLEVVKPKTMRGLHIEVPDTRFSDIGGQFELKKILQKGLQQAITDGGLSAKVNVKPGKGLLMYGPPGCSKTLVGKAVATEAGINFLLVNAGELIGSYLGESEKRIRELFRRARDASPCVIFFDEFETVGADRKDAHKGLNVVQTLLTELDGVKPLQGVFVLAATNEPELLDPALLRPGRLNPHVMVGLPDADARREMIQIKLRGIDDAYIDYDDLKVDSYTEATEGLTGAEVIEFVDKALLKCCDDSEETNTDLRLRHSHFEGAVASIKRSVSTEQVKRYQDWGSMNAN